MSNSGRPFNDHAAIQSNSDLLDYNKPDFNELDLGSLSVSRPSPISPASKRSSVNTNAAAAPSQLAELETTSRSGPLPRNSKPAHRRSSSTGAPLIYSGYNSSSNTTSTSSSSGGGGGGCAGGSGTSSSVSSPNIHLYPTGNICPSGKILKSNFASRNSTKTEKLSSSTVNYGHGNIIKNSSTGKPDPGEAKSILWSSDPEEVKRAGNELYRKGNFSEALSFYERAIAISPENAAYRSNRAAALTMLGRLGEAVMECEEAVRLDPGYTRAHQRLTSLYLRLGQVENAGRHLGLNGQPPETTELQKLHSIEKHLNRCTDARKISDWKTVLRECDAAVVGGAASSPQIIACKAEAYLKVRQLEDADSTLADVPKVEPYPSSCSHVKFFGMFSEAYVLYVRALVHMALGRFDNAVVEAERAGTIDYCNVEIAMLVKNVKMVNNARARGKELFNIGKFEEACSAYGEGLKYNLCDPILYCNRAVCWSKLGLWEQSVHDCNLALRIQPTYTKALLRRAVSNAKLERWGEAVKDYEILKKELPGDSEVAESLSRAHEALKKSRGEEFSPKSSTLSSEPNSSKSQTRKNSVDL